MFKNSKPRIGEICQLGYEREVTQREEALELVRLELALEQIESGYDSVADYLAEMAWLERETDRLSFRGIDPSYGWCDCGCFGGETKDYRGSNCSAAEDLIDLERKYGVGQYENYAT